MTSALTHPTHSVLPGSSNYYACLFLPAHTKQQVLDVFDLYLELARIPNQSTDTSFALNKTQWWLQDIERLYHSQAEHPKLQKLSPWLQQQQIDKTWLINILMACQQDIEQTRYLDQISLNKYAKLGCGSLYQIIQHLITFNTTTDYSTNINTLEFGKLIRLAQIIINIGEDARRGRVYLPHQLLQQHGVATKDILNSNYSKQFNNLIQQQIKQLLQQFKQYKLNLVGAPHYLKLFIKININIYYKQLLTIEKNNYQILHQHIDITPFNKFCTAWKSKFFN